MVALRKPDPIQRFEHTLLKVNTEGFLESHWKKLAWYNEAHGGKYFSLVPNGIKFKSYVGVIQVDDLTIEILPKIDKATTGEDKSFWQGVLLDMLRECQWLKVYTNEKASLKFKHRNIMDAYLEIFIRECENIMREGLIKSYRTNSDNLKALKGKLLFSKQIQHNFIHQERFYTKYQSFDRENFFNRVLLKTLKVIPFISDSPALKDRVYRLLLDFPELEDINVEPGMFDSLQFNRRTLRYAEAIEIAAMILLQYRPDIKSGQKHILALLFNMNDLWEEYIFRQIFKHKNENWKVYRQIKRFWKKDNNRSFKIIKPDIIITDMLNGHSIVVDTKWKMPENKTPSDADLKQMFVYNDYWKGKASILLYPAASYKEKPEYRHGTFVKDSSEINECGLMWISVLNSSNNGLDKSLGIKINQFCDDIFQQKN